MVRFDHLVRRLPMSMTVLYIPLSRHFADHVEVTLGVMKTMSGFATHHELCDACEWSTHPNDRIALSFEASLLTPRRHVASHHCS